MKKCNECTKCTTCEYRSFDSKAIHEASRLEKELHEKEMQLIEAEAKYKESLCKESTIRLQEYEQHYGRMYELRNELRCKEWECDKLEREKKQLMKKLLIKHEINTATVIFIVLMSILIIYTNCI